MRSKAPKNAIMKTRLFLVISDVMALKWWSKTKTKELLPSCGHCSMQIKLWGDSDIFPTESWDSGQTQFVTWKARISVHTVVGFDSSKCADWILSSLINIDALKIIYICVCVLSIFQNNNWKSKSNKQSNSDSYFATLKKLIQIFY